MNQEHFVSDPSKVNIWRHVKYDYDFIYRNQFKLIIYSQEKHQRILGLVSVNLGSWCTRPTIPCWIIDNGFSKDLDQISVKF